MAARRWVGLGGVLLVLAAAGPVSQARWKLRTPLASPPARAFHAMAYDSKRKVTVVFGGVDVVTPQAQPLGDTWEWDGNQWMNVAPAGGPSARALHAMVYDSVRGVTVLFGGVNNMDPTGRLLGDTWEWDGVSWKDVTPAVSPPVRGAHAMAFDIARGVTVLFGGETNGRQDLQDTWEWDGATWRQVFPDRIPRARKFHALAYDAARGVTTLFGGDTMGVTQDTWTWDGINWSPRVKSIKPSARLGHSLVYESNLGLILLFGGQDAGTKSVRLDDTWQWDGNFWRKVAGALPPPPDMGDPPPVGEVAPSRLFHAMAYDAARSAAVLFAGTNKDGLTVNETWEFRFDSDGDGILDDGDVSGEIGNKNCFGGNTVGCDDNCVDVKNPDQTDVLSDGMGDFCFDPDEDGVADDGNESGVAGDVPCTGGATLRCDDNCPLDFNPDQADIDSNGIGNACEPANLADTDHSGRVDGFDLVRMSRAFGSSEGSPLYDPDVDLVFDGQVDGRDLAFLAESFGKPSAFAP